MARINASLLIPHFALGLRGKTVSQLREKGTILSGKGWQVRINVSSNSYEYEFEYDFKYDFKYE